MHAVSVLSALDMCTHSPAPFPFQKKHFSEVMTLWYDYYY